MQITHENVQQKDEWAANTVMWWWTIGAVGGCILALAMRA